MLSWLFGRGWGATKKRSTTEERPNSEIIPPFGNSNGYLCINNAYTEKHFVKKHAGTLNKVKTLMHESRDLNEQQLLGEYLKHITSDYYVNKNGNNKCRHNAWSWLGKSLICTPGEKRKVIMDDRFVCPPKVMNDLKILGYDWILISKDKNTFSDPSKQYDLDKMITDSTEKETTQYYYIKDGQKLVIKSPYVCDINKFLKEYNISFEELE